MVKVIQNSVRLLQTNAPTISGYTGLAAGSCVLAAGGYSLDNPWLVFAGILEWSSFGTTAFWGKNDTNKGDDAKVNFSLSKGIRPWKYPIESFILQQGVAGLAYAGAGINWKEAGSLVNRVIDHTVSTSSGSPVKDGSLVVVGGLCVFATIIQNTAKERPGLLHPRTLSSACLLISCFGIAASAAAEHSGLLGAAAGLFAISNISSGISRRGESTEISEVELQNKQIEPAMDKAQYYDDARTGLIDAVERLRQTLVIGEIYIKLNDADPTTSRVIARFPPDNSLYAPEEGYIMEVFDVKTCKPNGKLAPTYEALRWNIDKIFFPETVDGISSLEGQTVHNLGQLMGTILRRSDGLVFFDDTPPAARGFAVAAGSPRPS